MDPKPKYVTGSTEILKPEYTVVMHENRDAFCERVSTLLADGYQLHGGLIIAEWGYAQAMVKNLQAGKDLTGRI